MHFVKKANLFLLGLTVFLALGCGKDDDATPDNKNNPTQQEVKCLVAKIYSPGGGPNQVSRESFYDADRRLIRQNEYSNQFILFEYDATGLIVTRKFYSKPDSLLTRYDVAEYNQQKFLTKLTTYSRSAGTTQITEIGFLTQEYNAANQLIKRSNFAAANKMYPYRFSNYTYLPNGEIKEEIYQNQNNTPVLFMTSFWTFDNKNSPVTSALLQDGFGYGKGNVLLNTDIDAATSDTTIYAHTYQYNAHNYPTQEQTVVTGGSNYTYTYLFDYNCQ